MAVRQVHTLTDGTLRALFVATAKCKMDAHEASDDYMERGEMREAGLYQSLDRAAQAMCNALEAIAVHAGTSFKS